MTVFYEEPFVNVFGERFFWRGTCKLSDSNVIHAWVVHGRQRLIGFPPVRGPWEPSNVRGPGTDMCYSGVNFAEPRHRRLYNLSGTPDQVNCKKCLKTMKRTAIMQDVAWEV